MHTAFDSFQQRFMMRYRVARTNYHNIGSFFIKHLKIVGVNSFGADQLLALSDIFDFAIDQRNGFHSRQTFERQMRAVSAARLF